MKRGMRATIRRKPDYERDPDWDLSEILEGKTKNPKRQKYNQRERRVDDINDDFYLKEEQ